MTGWVKGVGLLALGVMVGRLIWAALTRSVEYDEAISLMVVRGVPSPAWPEGISTAGALRAALGQGVADPLSLLRDLRTSDVHPPLYFILLAGWVGVAGDSLLALRLPSLLMALACGLPLVGIARMLLGRERAPLALLALACSPVLMILGALARGYGLATLLVLVAVWGALALREAARKGDLPLGPQMALGLGAGLAPWAVHLATLVVPVVLLWSAVQGHGRHRLRWWLPFALALPLGLGWLWYVSGQLGNRPDQGGNPLALVDVALGLSLQIQALTLGLPRPLAGSGALVNLILGGLLSVALLVLAYATLIKGWLRPKAGWGLIWLTILAALMAPVALGLISGKLLLAPRYLVIAAPLLGLVLVAAMLRLSSGRHQSTPHKGLALTLLGGLAAVQLGLGWSMEAGGLTRPERWQAISDTVTGEGVTGQRVALILIDAGFGRGVPASMALSLPPDQPVQLLHGAGCDVAEPLPASAALVLSWRPISRQAVTAACGQRFALHRKIPAGGDWIDPAANNPGPPFILFTRR